MAERDADEKNRMPHWMRPPKVDDPDLSARVSLAHYILFSAGVVSTVSAIVFPMVFEQWQHALLVNGSVAGICWILMARLRGGFYAKVIAGTSMMGIGAVTLSIMVSSGIHSPAVLSMPAVIMVVGFLQGPRWAGMATLFFVLALLLIGLGEQTGWFSVPQAPLSELQLWTSFTGSLVVTGAVIAATVNTYRRDLSRADESRRRYAALIEENPDGMVGLSEEGHVLSCNASAAQMIGLDVADIVGQTFWQIPTLVEPVPELARSFVGERDESVAGEELAFVFEDAGGRRRHAQGRRRKRARSEGETGLQLALRDETRRVEAESERADLQATLIQTQKMQVVGQLAGGVAHDFNNYLTVIRTCTDTLANKLPDEGNEATLIAAISDAAERSSQLTRQLLAFSRKQMVQTVPCDLNKVLGASERIARRVLDARIELDVQREDEPVVVEADPAQLEVAILNLVVNAQDAMPEGGTLRIESGTMVVGEETTGQLKGFEPGLIAALSVTDDGVGMDAATLARACEPFFSTKGSGGTGLGLSTVYGIAEQCGGRLVLESASGKGTRATIYLPPSDAVPTTLDSSSSRPPPKGGSERLLLVEDQPLLRQVTATILRSHGYRVDEAGTAEVALELWRGAESGAFDLVVSDVVLPGMDGFELAEVLSAEDEDVVVQLMSGYSDPRVRGGRFVDDLLQKPFTTRTLLRRIRAQLDRAHAASLDTP